MRGRRGGGAAPPNRRASRQHLTLCAQPTRGHRARPLIQREVLQNARVCLTTGDGEEPCSVTIGRDRQFTFDHAFGPKSPQVREGGWGGGRNGLLRASACDQKANVLLWCALNPCLTWPGM